MSFAGQTWWIIGASEGLGRALAQALDREGAHLILSARPSQRLDQLAHSLETAIALPMDVTDAHSIAQAVSTLPDVYGIVYCAGLYDPMSTQNWHMETAEQICDVNFMGAMRVLGRFMPKLLKRGNGHIVLIGSLAGYFGLPSAIGYGASKAALIHLGENMQADLKNTDIHVQVINPGFIKTRLTDKNNFKMPMLRTPQQAATTCINAIKRKHLHSSFPAPFSWVFHIAALLPRRLIQRFL